ncbi:hypothetical protein M501DRAFT_1006735 [Patellaria atrata CBS 101060]|uniref:Exocyst complex component SEC5 n=1 Tax=Patellaria atrata CBS 101060 TaxID=1346257 RepID=A0A9P4S6V0_9PEZI|nr:hypothetical protein M501DRAFT_1006735 [Patellaria atrata CBS 101060]
MAEAERTLLNHYNITTLWPSEWPAEKDKSESSDDEELPRTAAGNAIRRSKSRYSVLERGAGYRSSVPGAQKSKEGVETLVQKDEPDPLGSAPSVVQILRQRGLPVEDDMKLRNRFLLSSTTFSPALFLSQVHNEASTESLLQGLDFLSRSIEKKSASLKILVESNFERFVRAKATIDNVYNEMRNQGLEPESPRRPHSRHASKSSGHFRGSSNPLSPPLGVKPSPSDKKKNALLKESEYGVAGIKSPLLDVAVKAEEIWGPALGGRDREETLKAILAAVEKHRPIFEIGSALQTSIKRKDYTSLVENYRQAKAFANEARGIADYAVQNRVALSEVQTHQIIITARMWSDVEEQVREFKGWVWGRLSTVVQQPKTEANKSDEYMELIKILLELGVEDNPISSWLFLRADHLKRMINEGIELFRATIEVRRRELGRTDKPSMKMITGHLRAVGNPSQTEYVPEMDNPEIIAFWEHTWTCLGALLNTPGGLLGDVMEFWETAQSFIDGRAQRLLPVGIDGQSRRHHRLSVQGQELLQSYMKDLVGLFRDGIFSFFADPPIDDLSLILSPIPPTPDTPRTPLSATLSPIGDALSKFDANNPPPPASPLRGESWEKFAFWAPWSNSLSGVYHLSKMLLLVGNAASELASLTLVKSDSQLGDQLKTLVGGVRERCVQAVCAAWNIDAEHCRVLEDWTRAAERRDLTNMPSRFLAFEGYILGTMQKILYLSEAMNKSGSDNIVVPPSTKLLQMVRSQFVTTLYKVLSGMVENAEKLRRVDDGGGTDDPDGLTIPLHSSGTTAISSDAVDASNKNVRVLLTLSNLQALKNDIVPQLISQFENNFTVKLTDESKTIRDVLRQIDDRLFQSYVRPMAEKLSTIIANSIAAPEWVPQTARPTDASPYVYEVLLGLVIVHTEVSTTAAPLTSPLLKFLLERVSSASYEAFKRRQKYSLAALMQATLDVEFMAQTLGNYTSEKASKTQSDIYLALDERTDNDARMRLQNELPELRAILKRLRDGTRGEFACFKRQRSTASTREGRPTSR